MINRSFVEDEADREIPVCREVSRASRASQRRRPLLLTGNQGGKALKWPPAHFNLERKISLLFRECGYQFKGGEYDEKANNFECYRIGISSIKKERIL